MKLEAMKELYENMNTQGRKGMHMDRMNMAFTPTNYDYIRVMSGITGQSYTKFVNAVLDADRERNGKVYRMAKELAKEIED